MDVGEYGSCPKTPSKMDPFTWMYWKTHWYHTWQYSGALNFSNWSSMSLGSSCYSLAGRPTYQSSWTMAWLKSRPQSDWQYVGSDEGESGTIKSYIRNWIYQGDKKSSGEEYRTRILWNTWAIHATPDQGSALQQGTPLLKLNCVCKVKKLYMYCSKLTVNIISATVMTVSISFWDLKAVGIEEMYIFRTCPNTFGHDCMCRVCM